MFNSSFRSRGDRWMALLVFFSVLCATPVYGQLTPSDDAYTDTANPTLNFGTKTTLGVVSPSQTAFILFDLSSIPAGYTSANVAKASLKLYVNTAVTTGSFNVVLVNGSWTEKTLTANTSPALGTVIAASVPLSKANAHDYVIIDVTTAVDAWLNETQANDGIALVANSPLSATFDSKENTTQSHPAELDIVFTGGGGGSITGITTGTGSGLTGGGTSGTLNLSLATNCVASQILQWNGSGWACSSAGTGTITGVTAGTDLIGGGNSGSVTLNVDTTKIPQLNLANTFTGNQTVNGNLSATGTVTGSSYQIGSDLFAFGSRANGNAFLGFGGNSTSAGAQNMASGAFALASNTTGTGNAAGGYASLFSNTTGTFSTAMGWESLGNNTSGGFNTAVGDVALVANTTGGENTAVGDSALSNNTTGITNTGIGESSLIFNQTGSYNSGLGYFAGPGSSHTDLVNATAIGSYAEVDASNAVVLGSIAGVNKATVNAKVGIGTTNPSFTLDVHGNGNFTGPVTFAPGQTFPGTGTITGVTPGTDLTGGGNGGNVTLNVDTTKVVTGVIAGTDLTGGGTGGVQTLSLDTTKVPQLAAANTFTNSQTVSGNLTATGVVTGSSYQIGSDLFAFGSSATGNAFVGFAGSPVATGTFNTGAGAFALLNVTSGVRNTAIGAAALRFDTTGSNNTASGVNALVNLSVGSQNTALGGSTLFNNGVGSGNSALGFGGLQNANGDYNTGVGYNAGPDASHSNITNSTAIGANAQVTASNSMVLGSINGVNGATASTNVGIGTTAPVVQLQVQGNDNTGTGVQSLTTNTSTSGNSFAIAAATSSAGVTSVMAADGLGTGPPATPSGYFGTFTNHPIGFVTGNVLRMFVDTAGRVGINTRSDNTLSVNGSADKPGGGSWGTFSDGRLKNLHGAFNAGLNQILKLQPVRYRYKKENGMGIRDSEEHVGFVAQDVQKVIPEAVTENDKGYLLVNNDPILWTMLNAIKDQQREILKQQAQIKAQQRQIIRLTGKVGVLESAARVSGHTRASPITVHASAVETHASPSDRMKPTSPQGN